MDNFKSPPPISARRTHSSSSAANPVAAVPVVPQRTTKTASKLVVFPPASPPLQPFAPSQPISIAKPPSASNMDVQSPGLDPSSHPELSSSVPEYPPAQPAEKPVSSHKSNPSGPRTEAEWISKESRNLLPRVTAYCAADAYDIKAIAAFLKTKHGVVGRVYDECLYISYEHRVAGGAAGSRHREFVDLFSISSASKLKHSQCIEPTETVKQEAEIHPRHSQTSAPPTTPIHANMPGLYANFPDTHLTDPHLTSPIVPTTESEDVIAEEEIALASSVETAEVNDAVGSLRRRHGGSTHGSGARLSALNNPPQIAGNYQSNTNPVQSNTLGVEKDYKWMGRNEVFLFDFGVIVLWNFTVEEENLYLSILKPFATSPRSLSDAEVEDFHFQYDFSRPINLGFSMI
ncbi:hypothetical protein BCR33DRAFT_801209 [Rhizoclosmatium globosum]|uniref:DUF155 domain-containing protein n=1 Tax=Rhizoclosmatium globosum TaxID=329046 RepID=A0A1Y2D2U0_9FUNG|nr:hypothetical protein BCR33DRAFT_801209 [Rhizoclosmatium globosum]|eukprot:ORY53608.1 hypothetical protein BCR33DRAFT_801209 [Rhizoclosmatium globosum]